MSDTVSEIFGYIVLVAAVVLFAWEYRAFAQREEEDSWLLTARRFRRRTIVSIVLAAIAVLITVEARGTINLRQLPALYFYVFSLSGLAVLLVVLAGIDLMDTAKSASRRAMEEFDAALEAEKRRVALEAEQRPGK
ncbi:MAG: hypothetical protein ACR2IE_01070 [Candidatus Sumerlaeaceae bacterium]